MWALLITIHVWKGVSGCEWQRNYVYNLFTSFNCYKISLWEKKAERSPAKYCMNCEMFSSWAKKMHLTSVQQVKYFVFSIFRMSIECLNTCQSTAWQRKRKEFGLLVFGWVFFLCHYGYWSIHCLATQENDLIKTVLVCVVFSQLLFIPALLT